MPRAFAVIVALAGTLIASCSGGVPHARIVAFTTSDDRAPRNTPVTLEWVVEVAGVQDDMLSCQLTRRLGDATTETPLDATCAGSLTDVPPAPLTATTVHYDLEVLKQPYDSSDPYLTETRSVTLDPALYATSATSLRGLFSAGVSMLADGSAIVTGGFENDATFGATTLMSTTQTDVFVAKTNPDGSWAWATRAGGPLHDTAVAVSTLADGSAIVTGRFDGSATFGATTLTSATMNDYDLFVAKIDPDGNWAWATRAGGTSGPFRTANSISTNTDGSAIITGNFRESIAFGTNTLTSAAPNDMFVARIDPDGAWTWAARPGATVQAWGNGVGSLADGGAIVTGVFFGSITFGATTIDSLRARDAYVARIGADGAW